jgi:endonuclease-3
MKQSLLSLRANSILRLLKKRYPDADVRPADDDPFQFLVCVMLSAQCTDAAVDKYSPALFARYSTPAAMARAPLRSIEKLIHSMGLYHTKARNIRAMSRIIMNKFGGKVPRTMDELTTIPGVGRKSASVILPRIFGVPGLAVDTHVRRVSGRLGLTKHKDPAKIEKDLCALIPPRWWDFTSLALIYHGRRVCHARGPRCASCFLRSLCEWPNKTDLH